MQMTTDARLWLDATVRRILAPHPLGDAERAGVTYELMSHLHAAGEARAAAAGRAEVTRADLEAALLDAGGETGMASAFVQPLAKPLQRAGFGARLAAFAIDVVVLGLTLFFVHGLLGFLLDPGSFGRARVEPLDDRWGLLPWGAHDASLHPFGQTLIALASAAVVLGYFTWLEGKEGRTLGKRAMDLRVMRADGKPMTYREALLRNLVKLTPPFLFLDVLAMLLGFREEKQRVSDRIAGTIVVKA